MGIASFIISGDIPLTTSYISIASVCILLSCIETQLTLYKSSSKFESFQGTTMKHPNSTTIINLRFKKCIHKNTSFRQFHIIFYSCESIEFSICLVTNTLNMNIKFEVLIKIDS